MKQSAMTALALTFVFFIVIGNSSALAQEYAIGAGDLLSITVFDEPDLSLSNVRVDGTGSISYPLLGEIKTVGLSSKELEALLSKRLLDGYLKKPKVSVSILQYRMFFVRGEVKKPGGYPFIDGLTVQKAVALAGGFTVRASEGKINIVRELSKNKSSEKVGLGALVNPGDVINVGESLF